MAVEMTYVVAGRVVVNGSVVPVGTHIPEAEDWKHRDTLVRQGLLAFVPLESVSEDANRISDTMAKAAVPSHVKRREAKEEARIESVEETGESKHGLTQEQYNDLTVEEVEELVEEGLLLPDEAVTFEENRPGRDRKGVLALAGEDTDDEDDDEDE